MGTADGWRKEVAEYVPCTCCGRIRCCTDLGTFTTDLSSDFDLADGTLTQTVLYCRDDSECRGAAQTLRLIPAAETVRAILRTGDSGMPVGTECPEDDRLPIASTC
jgi:hypothetical protein